MRTQTVEAKAIVGVSVRTSNALECDGATAQIGALWERFAREGIHAATPNAPVYGVYTEYESDANGAYTVTAGVEAPAAEPTPEGAARVRPGDYLVFEAKGQIPGIVVDTWRRIWEYFTAPDAPHTRAYTSDFELYTAPDHVAIHIAVK